MKKLFVVVVIAAVLWLAKLSFDLFQVNAQQTELMQQQTLLQQRNAGLNDQVVALKRRLSGTATEMAAATTSNTSIAAEATHSIEPMMVVGQQLDLVEFAMQQQQFAVALEKLNQLDQQLDQLSLAPALRMSLHQVIQKDRETLKQYVTERQLQSDKVKNTLQSIDQLLEKEILKPYSSKEQQKGLSFWQKWIQVESVEQPSPVLMQRSLVLKEMQLRLILAQQVLNQGQYPQFQQEITEIMQIMQQLPDASLKPIRQRLEQLKDIPVISVPLLNTRALIG
ncbi:MULTISPECIES: hypothetical protein [unclassified Acinetobacter]|uniref:hypothetical protein n=1 Tax=unclassified Acinetobacter TaxID=196816 RepID=UPI0015D3C752|nr:MULTISPECIES: hypothetical protein [unclassified Acinetobacter]UUS57898.1 hypothetical protein MST16_01380 [Acinetobacter sp. YH16040_T]